MFIFYSTTFINFPGLFFLTVVSWEENIEDLDEIQQILYVAKHLFDQTGQLAHLLSLIPPLYITH